MTRTRRAAAIEPESQSEILEGLKEEASRGDMNIEALRDVIAGLESTSETDPLAVTIMVMGSNQKWAFLETLRSTVGAFDLDAVIEHVKAEHGMGHYKLIARYNGKVLKHAEMGIGDPRRRHEAPARANTGEDMTKLLLEQAQASKSDMAQMMTLMMTMNQQNAQAQQAAAQQNTQMMIGLITAMMGTKDTPATMISALAPLMDKGEKSGGMKETMETLAAMKALVSGEGGGSTDENASFFEKAALGIMPILTKGLDKPAASPQPAPAPMIALPQGGPQMPPNIPRVRMPQGVPTVSSQMVPPNTQPRPGGAHPVLSKIAPDLLFFFRRGYDPEAAAENILDRLEQEGVSDDAIQGMALQFAASTDWIADLAREYAIDLSGNAAWAQQFLDALVRLYTESRESDTDTEGNTGSGGNT